MKPGWQTTEFWITLAVNTLSALVLADVFAPGSVPMKVIAVLSLVASQYGYTVARGRAKVADANAKAIANGTTPPPPSQGGFISGTLLVALALAGLAALTIGASGCTPSKRESTIKTTYSLVNVSQSAFLAWDADHQQQIVEHATSLEDGLAKLNAYKEKRAAVMTKFEGIYHMLSAASILNSDPDLTGAIRAWADLSAAIADITGKVLL